MHSSSKGWLGTLCAAEGCACPQGHVQAGDFRARIASWQILLF